MNLAVIILGIIVVLLLFTLYHYFNRNSISLAKETSLLGSNTIIPLKSYSSDTRYALGIWVYINSWNMKDNRKIIYTFPGKIELYLDPRTPTLYASVGVLGSEPSIITVTENFPIQKWTYVLLSVDNSYIDSYIDGKLIKSIELKGVQDHNTDPNMYIGGNPASLNDITIANFYRWKNPLAPQDVWNEYMKGNGISTVFSSYGVDLNLLKNNTTAATFTIF